MSIITAFYSLDGSGRPQETVTSMLRAMPFPKNTDDRVWSNGPVGLGFREQATSVTPVPISIPLFDLASGCAITCDARIDNRDEIIEGVGLSTAAAKEMTDAGLILKAYLKWNSDLTPHLLGDFVFAIWDPRERKLLFGRDPLGVRHFYYSYLPGRYFALASEAKALMHLDGVDTQLDLKSVGDYLNFNFDDRERTFFTGVKRLPATHCATVDERGLKMWEYWRPDSIEPLKWKDPTQYFEAFREEFTSAVRRRLRDAEPVGTFLSGGLDSSSITAVAARELAASGKSLPTYSAVWPTVAKHHPRIDEMEYMQAVIDHSRCDANFVNCDDQNPWKDIEDLIDSADHPVGFPNMYMHWEIYKAAAADGVKVLLDGFDGDTTVSHGYELFGDLARRRRFLKLYNQARIVNQNMPHKFHSMKSLFLKQGLDTVIPKNMTGAWMRLTRRTVPAVGSDGLVSRAWATLNRDFKRTYRELVETGDSTVQVRTRTDNSQWTGLTSGMFGKALEFSELVSRRHGLEPRYPFMDRRLIEFCIAVPPEHRIQNGWTRGVFRHAMEEILPDNVRFRISKGNLGIGLKLNLVEHAKEDIQRLVSKEDELLARYIDIDEASTLVRRFIRDPLKAHDSDCLSLVAIVHLSRWLEKNACIRSDCRL